MQLDANRLTCAEHDQCLPKGLCLYCGASVHFVKMYPSRPPRPAVSTLHIEPDISTLPPLTVQLLTPQHSVSVSALVDSGSSGNLVSKALLKRLDLPRMRQAQERARQLLLLPLHQQWDCVIDLLPGATLRKGRVYPLSIPEGKAMEDYIKEAL